MMKQRTKIGLCVIGGVVLLTVLIIGGVLLKGYIEDLNRFTATTICPNKEGCCPADRTFTVNGVSFKMVGIKGGSICCKGLTKKFDLEDFYLGETEVTQELWTAVMGKNPSCYRDSMSLPVENVNLIECLDFINKLDSISGIDFFLPSYMHWLYAAHLGNESDSVLYCGSRNLDEIAWYKGNSGGRTHVVKSKKANKIGLYDMSGNVGEWTFTGLDPLFYVMGGDFECDAIHCETELHEVDYATLNLKTNGLRLIWLPEKEKKDLE